MKISKPIIGIGLDRETKNIAQGGYSDYPWYALRTHYSDAVANNGGIPFLIPYHVELIDEYVEYCDGFIFPGGDADIDPTCYGEKPSSKITEANNVRMDFEVYMMKAVMKKNKPLLGICAGEQLLNVILGGTLHQDIASCIKTDIEHKPGIDPSKDRHYIDIKKGSLLHSITKTERYKVNSHHHQAVNKLGDGLEVSAVAPDGVIEAIEHPKYEFCLGVEWHPEYEKNKEDSLIIKALIAYSRKVSQ